MAWSNKRGFYRCKRSWARTNANVLQFTSGPGTWGNAVSQWSPAANASAFYCFDQSGNARLATQGVGNYVMTADYLMFGKEHSLVNGANIFHRFGGNWGYFRPVNPANHNYIRQRWYDSLNGQWLSKDPLGRAGGENLYQFVENNPLAWADPSGLIDIDIIRRCKEICEKGESRFERTIRRKQISPQCKAIILDRIPGDCGSICFQNCIF